jgi:hypothetical protein
LRQFPDLLPVGWPWTFGELFKPAEDGHLNRSRQLADCALSRRRYPYLVHRGRSDAEILALATGSLKGYAVEDESGHRYNFTDTVFTKGQTITLDTGEGTDIQTDLYWGATGTAIWNNDGDTVKVLDSTGDIVVSQSYS